MGDMIPCKRCGHFDAMCEQEMEQLRAEADKLAAAMTRIQQWADAYPLDVFPEPDFAKVNEVLTSAGLSLDQVSASAMRRVISGVGEIASTALS